MGGAAVQHWTESGGRDVVGGRRDGEGEPHGCTMQGLLGSESGTFSFSTIVLIIHDYGHLNRSSQEKAAPLPTILADTMGSLTLLGSPAVQTE